MSGESNTGTPPTDDGEDPFEVYRGCVESDETMSERMRRLRDEYPRSVCPE